MKKAGKGFSDFWLAAQENNDLWVELSRIGEADQLDQFFKGLGFTVDPDHVDNILIVKNSFTENPGLETEPTIH